VAWGSNGSGQSSVPPLPAGHWCVEIASGGTHNLALLDNGSILAWGDNYNGQCNVPTLPAGVRYVQIAAGHSHCIARRSDGAVVAWGDNGQGQCNVPALGGGFVCVDVAAGDFLSLARFELITPSASYCSGDGSGTACPCANPGTAGAGCANSLDPNGARLDGAGTASLGNDTYQIAAAGMPDSTALYLQGSTQQNGGAGSVFGDGLRCVAGSIVRLGIKTNAGGASQYPSIGDPSVSLRGGIAAPGTRRYQVWYRNAAAFCTPSTFNLTNGVEVTWVM
jgi:hypothetical protein